MRKEREINISRSFFVSASIDGCFFNCIFNFHFKVTLLMRILLISILLLIFSLSVVSKNLEGKIIKVSDGDTVVLLDSTNTKYRIRLDGIDAPEKGQPFGTKATNFVKTLIAGKMVKVEWSKKDRYGRILGYVFTDTINVNKELLKEGLAWHYKHFNQDDELAKLELEAKSKKLNIWSEVNPIEPYQWRKMKNKKRR